MKDLEIRIKLKRDTTAVQAHVADMQKMAAATAQATTASKQETDQAVQGVAQATQAQAKLDAAKAQSAAKDRDAQGRFVAGIRQGGDEGVSAFGKMTAAGALMQVGLTKAVQLGTDLARVMKEAAQHYRDMSKSFTDQRDRLAELAAAKGEQPDNDFTLKNAKFNKEAGMKPGEGLGFRMQFANSGEQFKGRQMEAGEFDQFEGQAAQLAMAKGMDPEQAGELAGSLVGFKDRSKMGAGASEDALGKFNSGTAILGRGKGRNSVLVNQFSMASAAALNEDEFKGAFTDSDEVATAVSVMAENHDAQSAEMIRAANRGLSDFDGKAKGLLEKAGVTLQMKWAAKIKAIAPIVAAEAKERGVDIDDVLKESFEDHLTREAIGVGINRGVYGGIFADREEFAKTVQGPKPALDTIGKFKGSERGQLRAAEAAQVEAENQIGSENSEVELLRQQATTDLTAKREIGTTRSAVGNWAAWIGSFGTVDLEENKTQARMGDILRQRAEANGQNVEIKDGGILTRTAEESNYDYRQQIAASKGILGGDATGLFSGGVGGAASSIGRGEAGGGQQLAATHETNKLLREQNKLLDKLAPPPGPKTIPLRSIVNFPNPTR